MLSRRDNCLPLGPTLALSKTPTLVKTADLEVIRLELPAGKEIPTRQAPGEITVKCWEERVAFTDDRHTSPCRWPVPRPVELGTPLALAKVATVAELVTLLRTGWCLQQVLLPNASGHLKHHYRMQICHRWQSSRMLKVACGRTHGSQQAELGLRSLSYASITQTILKPRFPTNWSLVLSLRSSSNCLRTRQWLFAQRGRCDRSPARLRSRWQLDSTATPFVFEDFQVNLPA